MEFLKHDMAKSLKHGLLSSCGVDTYKIASSNLIRRLSAPISSRRDWDNNSTHWHKSPNESLETLASERLRGVPGRFCVPTNICDTEIWQFNLKTVKGPVMWQSLIYFLTSAPAPLAFSGFKQVWLIPQVHGIELAELRYLADNHGLFGTEIQLTHW